MHACPSGGRWLPSGEWREQICAGPAPVPLARWARRVYPQAEQHRGGVAARALAATANGRDAEGACRSSPDAAQPMKQAAWQAEQRRRWTPQTPRQRQGATRRPFWHGEGQLQIAADRGRWFWPLGALCHSGPWGLLGAPGSSWGLLELLGAPVASWKLS